MTVAKWMVTGLVAFVCIWIAWVALGPFILDGHLYHIEQPVPVIRVTEEKVFLRVTRTSLLDMPATCSRELVCEQVYQLPDSPCPIQKGPETFDVSFPIPNGAEGICTLRGIVQYRVAGAPLSHSWTTVPFEIEKGGETE